MPSNFEAPFIPNPFISKPVTADFSLLQLFSFATPSNFAFGREQGIPAKTHGTVAFEPEHALGEALHGVWTGEGLK